MIEQKLMTDICAVTRANVEELLEQALKELFKHDEYLLRVDANERSITHKLAEYVQRFCPDWHVDCEYNRDAELPKRLLVSSLSPTKTDTDAKTVFPDIVVHQRGTDTNLLVVEVKKSSNCEDGSFDKNKLRAFQEKPFCYKYAAFVHLLVGDDPEYTIEWITQIDPL
jgi:hypothetical protein